MQTIQMNGVTIHNVETTNGLLTVEVAETVSRLTALAGLYDLGELDYSHAFLTTTASLTGGECTHCQGSKEIAILQTATNENVVVPCACSDEFVVPIAGDIGGSTSTASATSTITATVVQPVNASNVSGTLIDAHMDNQIALMKTFGYDFTEVNGQPCRFYQFVVMGQDSADGEANELTKMLATLDPDAQVYSLGLTNAVNAQAEFAPPRILTHTEMALYRSLKDLKQVQEIQPIIDKLEQDFAHTDSLESHDIALSPQHYVTPEFTLQTFVRMVVTLAKQQNARYDEINHESGTRIATAFYLHEPTNTYYQATEYFINGESVPSNYTLAKESPTEGQRAITTQGFNVTVANNLADIESALAI